jgi:uncharacterized protein
MNFFPAPFDVACLYVGKVMHARLNPFGHRFSYRVFSLLLDIDQQDRANHQTWLFGIGKKRLMTFADKDHGYRDGSPLRPWVEECLKAAGTPAPHRILLLCYPKIFGYVFNPLSVFYCYDIAGALTAVIYEVRNTFGEKHAYVAPVSQDELSDAGLRQERDKLFYVSPFLKMNLTYRFRMRPPTDKNVSIRILEMSEDKPILSATFNGEYKQLNTWNTLKALLLIPFVPFKVIAAIHWEALRLWIMGARLSDRPSPPDAYSFKDTQKQNECNITLDSQKANT